MASVIRVVAMVALVGATSGCSLGAILSTKKEVLSEDRFETRTTGRRASVDGSSCYVDEDVRLVSKAHVHSWYRVGGAFNALLFGLIGTFPGKGLYALPVAADGLLAFVYSLAVDRKTTKSTHWKETLETSSCKTSLTTVASKDGGGPVEAPPRGPRSRDSDADGITDDLDACTFAAEDKDGFADDDGCPDDDNDRDGIVDPSDGCPLEPEDKDGHEDANGCPDPDNDGDQILDASDKCRDVAEDKDGFEDGDGCVDLDNDKDGVADTADKCPNVAEDKDGFQDDDGCIEPDDDQDGVADASDKCPAEVETKNGYQDGDGCADELPASLKRVVGVVAGVRFARDTSGLAKGTIPALDRVAKLLAKDADLKIAVELHGSASAQTQALSVRDYVLTKGIAPNRVVAVGFDDKLETPRVELALISDLVPAKQPPKGAP